MYQYFLGFLFLNLYSSTVFAYLDPASGSILISSIVGIFTTAVFFFRGLYFRLKYNFFLIFNIKNKQVTSKLYDIVIYSEGKQYWSTFAPLLFEFEKNKQEVLFLTSDEDDLIFNQSFEYIHKECIGKGIKAFLTLNFLEAKICILTTPGLDVLQLKRSKKVQHYTHIIHSPADTASYELFSFDYYDSMFVNGQHQIDTIRKLESIRKTQAKDMYLLGIPYYDYLIDEYKKLDTLTHKHNKTILIAPTWGGNNLLNNNAIIALLDTLLELGFSVIVRPHPQSYISETQMLSSLEQHYHTHSQLAWDNNSTPIDSFQKADIMISDISGVIFDYAFILEKPVITIKSAYSDKGLEVIDTQTQPWELTVLNEIGYSIEADEIKNISNYIDKIEKNQKQIVNKIVELRAMYIQNFGNSSSQICKKIQQILSTL